MHIERANPGDKIHPLEFGKHSNIQNLFRVDIGRILLATLSCVFLLKKWILRLFRGIKLKVPDSLPRAMDADDVKCLLAVIDVDDYAVKFLLF